QPHDPSPPRRAGARRHRAVDERRPVRARPRRRPPPRRCLGHERRVHDRGAGRRVRALSNATVTRYAHPDGRTWQIEHDGQQLVLADDAQPPSTRRFVSPDAAAVQRDKLIAQHLADGFVAVAAPLAPPTPPPPPPPDPDPRDPAFEAAIAADPDAADNYT